MVARLFSLACVLSFALLWVPLFVGMFHFTALNSALGGVQ